MFKNPTLKNYNIRLHVPKLRLSLEPSYLKFLAKILKFLGMLASKPVNPQVIALYPALHYSGRSKVVSTADSLGDLVIQAWLLLGTLKEKSEVAKRAAVSPTI